MIYGQRLASKQISRLWSANDYLFDFARPSFGSVHLDSASSTFIVELWMSCSSVTTCAENVVRAFWMMNQRFDSAYEKSCLVEGRQTQQMIIIDFMAYVKSTKFVLCLTYVRDSELEYWPKEIDVRWLLHS